MTLYRGYVRTNGKQSIDKFKDIDILSTLEIVQKHSSYAGVLNNTTILVDFDDENTSNKAFEIIKQLNLKCKVIKTNKGIHVYFKTSKQFDCNTKIILACGLIADIKCGVNSYGVLKLDGNVRNVIYDTKDYEEIPIYLYPTKEKDSTLFGKAEGDRNNTLFTYILTLQRNGFEKEQIKEIIRFINNYIFESPLDDDELEKTVLRDEAFKKMTFLVDKKFMFQKFAETLIEENHVCKINDKLHIYKNGVYVYGNEEIEAVMIKLIPNLRSSVRTEVLKAIRLLSLENKELAPPNYIAFNNGVYDLNTSTLLPFDPSIIITNKIPWNYNFNANNEYASNVLNTWAGGNDKVRVLLEEIIGMCMYRYNKISSCFIIVGNKDNGKSSFIHLLQFMLGYKNYSSIGLEDIETRFKNADIFGKLANLGDDISDRFIPNTEIFKKLVTGERVQFERKGQDPFEFNSYAKMIFNANSIPRIKDDTGAVIEKRVTIIPFNADFSQRKGDPFLDQKMNTTEFMEYVIKLGVDAIKRVVSNKGFTMCDVTQKAKEKYIYENDPVLQFIDEYGEDNIYMKDTRPILIHYQVFCERNGFKSISSQYLNKGILRILGYDKLKRNETIGGKNTTVYYYGKKIQK